MSFDRKIDFVCPHLVVEEALFPANDRQTIHPLRPIATGISLKIRLNSLVDIPSQGVFVPAAAIAARPGPFNIVTGVNDQLVVQVDALPEQTVIVPAGQGITSRQLAKDLNLLISGVTPDISPKGRLRINTRTMGRASTLMFRTQGSTLAPTLLLPTDRQFRGRQTQPGWSLVRDPLARSDQTTREVVLDYPLRGFNDFVELNYVTARTECRRCGGLGVENDWRYNVNGDVIEVRDEALLIQEIQKIMFTIQGSNNSHSWYGTNIINTVGKKLSAIGLVQAFIVGDIREAFRRWQSIKRQQEENAEQFVSDEEFPFQLLQVSLEPDDRDPTILFVNATIQSRSQRPLQIARGVRVPLPADILGGSVQDGIFRQSISGPTGVDTVFG